MKGSGKNGRKQGGILTLGGILRQFHWCDHEVAGGGHEIEAPYSTQDSVGKITLTDYQIIRFL